MRKVYIVQQPAYYDREAKLWVSKYDLSAAGEYGELIFLLGPGNIFKDRLSRATKTLREKLKDINRNDHILAVGDPVAIALTTMIAGIRCGGRINILKFDRVSQRYESYALKV